MIELISEITQKSGADFALLDDSAIRGSLHCVEAISDLDTIPRTRLKDGTLVMCTTPSKALYVYNSNTDDFEPFAVGGSGGSSDSWIVTYGNGLKKEDDVETYVRTVSVDFSKVITQTKNYSTLPATSDGVICTQGDYTDDVTGTTYERGFYELKDGVWTRTEIGGTIFHNEDILKLFSTNKAGELVWDRKGFFSGSYNDLSDVPDFIVTDENYVHTDNNYDNNAVAEVAKVADKANTADLSTVATTGSYNDLLDQPENVSDFTNDAGYLVATDIENKVDKIDGKDLSTNDFTDEDKAEVDKVKDKANTADLATVALSGEYSDLLNTPTNVSSFTNDSGYLTANSDEITNKSEIGHTHEVADIIGLSEADADVTEEIVSNIELGGISVGQTIAKGTTITDFIKSLIVKYLSPTVSLAISPSTTLYKVGQSIDALFVAANVTKKSNPLEFIKYYVDGTLVNTKDTTTDASLSNGGSFIYAYTTAITSDTTVKVVVSDGTATVESSKTIEFINPMYKCIGSATPTEILQKKGNYTYSNITCVNDVVQFYYPASYGSLSSILDKNSFECISSFVKTTETLNSISYNVYTSGRATLSGFSYTFKF